MVGTDVICALDRTTLAGDSQSDGSDNAAICEGTGCSSFHCTALAVESKTQGNCTGTL